MKTRQQIVDEELVERDKKLIKDYYKRSKGEWVYSIKELAEKYSISVPSIYEILRRRQSDARE